VPEESTAPDPLQLTHELSEAEGVDATMRFYGADAVYDMSQTGMGIFEGPPAIRGFLEGWYEAYDDEYSEERLEVTHVGNGVVFAAVRHKASLSGSPVRGLYGYVLVWDDGTLTRITVYTDVDEAHAAAERLAESRR